MVTALPPDPDPVNTPGVEPGGGVPPGETPPDSANTTATANSDPARGRESTRSGLLTFIAVAAFVLVFGGSAVYLVLRLLGVVG